MNDYIIKSATSTQSQPAFSPGLTPFEAVAQSWNEETEQAKREYWRRAGRAWKASSDSSRRKTAKDRKAKQ